ncbi:hypothetical protein QTP88_025720 [Uroleucon formosanum]
MLKWPLNIFTPHSNVNLDSAHLDTEYFRNVDYYQGLYDYNITYSTKEHENDAVSVRLRVEEMKKKSNLNPALYYKHQGITDSTVPHFTISKKKRSSKIMQINTAHRESKQISQNISQKLMTTG